MQYFPVCLFLSVAITVGFGITTVEVLENATSVTLRIHKLIGTLERTVLVDFSTMSGTALGKYNSGRCLYSSTMYLCFVLYMLYYPDQIPCNYSYVPPATKETIIFQYYAYIYPLLSAVRLIKSLYG